MRMLGRITKGCNCPMCRRADWPVTRLAKRAEHRAADREVRVTLDELLGPELFLPFLDPSDCQHGCNGDCEQSGGERCDFTCHDRRCENCTRPAENWMDTGWFCSAECWGEYGAALIRHLRQG